MSAARYQTAKQRLLSQELGRDLMTHVVDRHRFVSYRTIATEIALETGIPVNVETLRRWVYEYRKRR